ncbi:golgin subfamily A member 6-like protein 22 isoform X2 [Dysidea avara]|uniref:golgin subfamily A member 6-like protein 22 isoform X2 n=1 Tax=Dysidea avara TaxID=196820 RepID=UPI0033310051
MERLIQLATDLLPSLSLPPEVHLESAVSLTSREEERRRLQEDELREAREKERARILEEKRRHLEVLANKEKQCIKNKRRYVKLMSIRIEQQQQEAKKQQEIFEKRREKEQAKEKARLLKKKPARYRGNGETDYSFLAHLPQSLFYKIVAMENELKKSGKLNNIQEVKAFWDEMLAPPTTTVESSYKHAEDNFIEEEDEDVTNSWAVTTTVIASSYKSRFPKSRKSIMEQTKFVPVQIPVLKPIEDIFSTENARKREEQRITEHKARIDLIQTQSRAVNEMYHTSRANELATRRLLHESGLLQEEPMKLFSKQETKMDAPKSKVKLRSKPVRKQVTSRTASSRKPFQDTTSLITSLPVNSILPNQDTKPDDKLVPLSIKAVEKDGPVKEAKQSSLWKNYTKQQQTIAT